MRCHIWLGILAGVIAFCGSAEPPTAQVPPFTQQIHTPYTTEDGLPSNDVTAIAVDGDTVSVNTTAGPAAFKGGAWTRTDEPASDLLLKSRLEALKDVAAISGRVTDIAKNRAGGPIGYCVGTEDGLYVSESGEWYGVLPESGDIRWAPKDVRAVAFDDDAGLWFAAPQGVGYRDRAGAWSLYTGADGLPFNDFTCMDTGPDGAVWFGTTDGAIVFQDGEWGFRSGRRWLLDDAVRDIAVAANGDVWIATAGGVSRIEAREMTLAEKAAFYEDEIDSYHRRTPFGYVVNAGLEVPGDKSTAEPFPTDNDGQYTGLYVGAEALGYAATGDPERKKRAKAGFEALAFLSEVTQGGSHPAPRGFIARAIMPTDGWDPNERDNAERDRKKQEEDDHLWKILDPRWPVSEDGKWYWKTDTSSDELDGHYFAYGLYYDHCAETEEEKARVRDVVSRVTDHLIAHNYRLVDHDGTPTRWAHFAPEDLNEDPDWWTERGLNSLSVLTYLTIAHHVTGEQKYRDEYERLAFDHFYALNGMVMPKLQFGPGSHVQFDDKMAFMNYYHLIRYETDPELLRMYYTSIYYYWNVEKYEMNPFFNFVYAACCYGKIRTDQWGDLDLTPPSGLWLEQSVDTLKRYPMDLLAWEMDNRHRLDILPLPDHVREPGGNKDKGYRVNGYVLPIDERQSLSWSEDFWSLHDGGNGTRLRDGCPYLLAYYMGLHHGYIAE